MQPACSTRGPTVAFLPFHSRTSGLFGTEEPAISSIIAPSAKISPALIMHLSVAFLPFHSRTSGSSVPNKPDVLLWNGKKATVGPRVEHAGCIYEAPQLDPILWRGMRLPTGVRDERSAP